MAIIVKFTYDVKPGRMQDFIAKLVAARSPEFTSKVMPKSVRLFRNDVPGSYVFLLLEYDDMAAYGQRTTFETTHEKWQDLFKPTPDSPELLVGIEFWTELDL